jgi:hypothetical protein
MPAHRRRSVHISECRQSAEFFSLANMMGLVKLVCGCLRWTRLARDNYAARDWQRLLLGAAQALLPQIKQSRLLELIQYGELGLPRI